MIKYYVLVLAIVSVYGRVTEREDIDVSNVIEGDSKIVKINIIFNDINSTNENEPDANTKKTCLDVDNNLDSDNKPCDRDNRVDNGTALMLTPFIEAGLITEARNASKVDPSLFLGVESYSGFLTVDKELKSHLFFWYFPALKPANDTPWLIWLQGGPGASSLTGLFDEFGPFKAKPDGTLRPNPFTWLQNHSIVFIDNPVGTGFSFTESADGYVEDLPTYAKHLHSATKQLVQIFPELRVAPLYVAGESYAGKYVPALGMEIHRHRDVPGGDINLKGLMIGNAYVEPSMISEIVRPFYHFGLLEKEEIDTVMPLIKSFQKDIAENKSIEAKTKWNTIVVIFLKLSHQQHAYNFLRDELAFGSYANLLAKSEIKRALHVGDIKFSVLNSTVNIKLAPDFLSNARPMFEELLEHYRVLAYCGQLDQMLPCAFTSDSYRKWKWSGSNDFRAATRHSYVLNRRVAGYHKSGGGLTWAVIRGAGHLVPMDAPGPIQRLVSDWTHSEPLPAGAGDMNLGFLSSWIQNYTSTAPVESTDHPKANLYL